MSVQRYVVHLASVIMFGLYIIYSRNFRTSLAGFLVKKRGCEITRGIFGRHCFKGDFQVRSGVGYPIHKLEVKCFGVII